MSFIGIVMPPPTGLDSYPVSDSQIDNTADTLNHCPFYECNSPTYDSQSSSWAADSSVQVSTSRRQKKEVLKKLKASSYFIFHPNSVLQFLHDAKPLPASWQLYFLLSVVVSVSVLPLIRLQLLMIRFTQSVISDKGIHPHVCVWIHVCAPEALTPITNKLPCWVTQPLPPPFFLDKPSTAALAHKENTHTLSMFFSKAKCVAKSQDQFPE